MKKQCVLLSVCLGFYAVMLMLLPSVALAEDHQEQAALPSASVALSEDDYVTHFLEHLVTSNAKYTGADPTELRKKLTKAGNAEGTTGILQKLWVVLPIEIDLEDTVNFVIQSAPALWNSDNSKKAKVTAVLKELVSLIPVKYLGYVWTELQDCPRCRDYAYDFAVNLSTAAWDKVKTGGRLGSDTAASFKNWLLNSSEKENNTEDKSENSAEQKPSFWASAWGKASELGNSALQTGGDWLSEKAAFAKESLSELGESAWQKTKEGGKWIGEKATSALDSVTDSVTAGLNWLFN